MSDFIRTCEKTIAEVRGLLELNEEWIERYAKYAPAILKNRDMMRSHKTMFHEWAPLHLYMTVGSAKDQMEYSLRYRGQDVAKLNVKKENITITTTKYTNTNIRDFECDIELHKCGWRSEPAKLFRQHFSRTGKRTTISQKGNEEHRFESLLLTEFSKRKSADKLLLNIQPVKLAGIARFQMLTPLKASKLMNLEYSGASGGGIDIISRIGKSAKLCIMEVKDENTSSEPPAKVIQQGLAYATFVRELLRSKGGNDWWNIFGFKGIPPTSLDIYTTCVMPSSRYDDTSFAGIKLKIGCDSIHLHHLYFKEADHKLTGMETSLPQCQVNPIFS
jgi:hypothetical protein